MNSLRLDPCAAPSTVPSHRPSAVRPIATLARFEERAPGELADYFARSQGAAPAIEGDADIEATLGSLPAHHRGVLTLHYGKRVWPEAVTEAFGKYAAVAIRLHCADHPASGSTASLEQAAAERIAAATSDKRASPMLLELCARAQRLHERAVRAYAKAARTKSTAAARSI